MKTQRRLPIALAAFALLDLSARAAAQEALPGGGSVVSGSATIRAPAAGQLTVLQTSQRAIIDWNSFSIGAGQSVRFVQPGTDAAVLNRVTGSTSSTIAGSLSGNGQVFIVNPNGIAITPTGTVQLGGGFVASTLDVRNDDFMAGRLGFSARDGATGRVANAGTIEVARGGFVALLGDQVSNDGRISAPLGRVALGAGTQATLDLNGDGFLQIGWTGGPRNADSSVDVSGSVQAVGGRIELKAADARAALRSVVNVSGSLVATTVSGSDGAIVLEAGTNGSAQVSGQLDVSGLASAGRIAISANTVALDGDAARIDARSEAGHGGAVSTTAHDALTLGRVVIDASGATGGGSVLLGGDLRGGGTLAHARTTDVQAGTRIRADALVQGAGGSIVLWSDERTDFHGLLSARGAGSGAGGSAEVSSHGVLDFGGSVDLRAASGRNGELLLDPFNVTISTGADSNHNASFTATGNTSVINTTTLQTALAGANVTVSTGSSGAQSGDITVANALTWASGTTLTLAAARDVVVNAAITATNGGGLTATAGRTVSLTTNLTGSGAAFNVNLQASTSTSGSVNISNGTVTTNGGTFNASATQSTASTTAVSISNSTIDTGGGTLTIAAQHTTGGSSSNKSKAVALSNATLQIGSGTASITGTVALAGAANFADGIYATGSVTLGGTGNYNLVGTVTAANASTSAIGIELFNGSYSIGASHTSLTGSGVRGLVSDLHQTISVGSGSLAVTGTATYDSGVQFKSDTTLVNTGGTMSFAGNSALYRGLDLIAGATLNVTGTVSLSGANTCGSGCRDTPGARLSDGITLNSGNLSITGGSVIGAGVSWSNGNVSSAIFSNLGAGLFSLTGSSTSGNGFDFARTSGGTTIGALTFSGSSGSGSGVSLLGGAALTQSSGNLKLTGASTSGLGFNQASGSAVTNAGTGTLTLGSTSNAMTLAGAIISNSATVTLHSAGDVTLASGATVQGSSPVIDATGHFVNQAGSGALTATSGRWLIYSADASGNTFGALDSGNAALWNATYAGLPPASVTASGSRYVFAHQPTLTFSSIVTSKVYGDDASSSLGARYTVSGYDAGVAQAYLADSANTAFSGAPTLSSNGAAATATVIGGPYGIAIARGSLASSTGYALVFDGSGSLAITPRALTVQAGNGSHVYGNTLTFAGTEFSTSGLVNGDSVASVSLASTGASSTANVGSYAITGSGASGSGLSNYSVSYLDGSLSVTPRALTVQAGNGSHVYGNTLTFAGTEFSTTGLVNGDSVASVSLASAGASSTANVGSYAITGSGASGSGLSNYSVSYLDGSLSVTPRALTVQAGNGSHVYGNTLTFAGTEFSTTGLVNGDSVASVSLASTGASSTANVGSYAITGSGASGSGLSNYSVSYLDGSLSVTPRALTVQAGNGTHVYGNTLTFAGTEFTTTGLVNGDSVASVSLASAGASSTANVGSYAITGSGASGSGLSNYSVSYLDGSLSVTPRALTVQAGNGTHVYGNTLTFAGTEFSTSGLVNGDSVASVSLASTGASSTANVGSYAITGSGASGSGLSNYSVSYLDGSLSVTPRALTVQAGNGTHVYGNTLTFAGTEFTTTGLVNGDSVASVSLASAGASSTANVGSYAITGSGASGSGLSNYSVSYLDGSLSVTPRALTVQAGNGSHVYGNTLTFAGTEFSTSGLVNGDSVASVSLASTGASSTANVGSYAITGSGASGSGLSNYSVSYLDGSLSVTPRALTVQAGNGSHVYGNTLTFAGTEFTTTGLVNGDSVASVSLASAGASSTANVGSYAITGSGASGSGLSNYSVSYLNGALTVTPRALYYVADVSTRPPGVSYPPLSGTIAGFVNGDTVASASSGSLRWSTTAGPETPAGLYAVVGAGLQVPSGNYVLAQAASNAAALRITDAPLPRFPACSSRLLVRLEESATRLACPPRTTIASGLLR